MGVKTASKEFTIEKSLTTFEVSQGDYKVTIVISPKEMMLLNDSDCMEFVFKNKATLKTVQHWENVLETMMVAVNFIKTEFKDVTDQ